MPYHIRKRQTAALLPVVNLSNTVREPFRIHCGGRPTTTTMNDVTLDFVHCPDAEGGHRMAYWQWGDPLSAHVVVCVHGLSRQGRDFDVPRLRAPGVLTVYSR